MDAAHTILVAIIAAASSIGVAGISAWFNKRKGLTPAAERYEVLMSKENDALRRRIADLEAHIVRLEAQTVAQEAKIVRLNQRLDELAEEKREVEAENVRLRIRLTECIGQ